MDYEFRPTRRVIYVVLPTCYLFLFIFIYHIFISFMFVYILIISALFYLSPISPSKQWLKTLLRQPQPYMTHAFTRLIYYLLFQQYRFNAILFSLWITNFVSRVALYMWLWPTVIYFYSFLYIIYLLPSFIFTFYLASPALIYYLYRLRSSGASPAMPSPATKAHAFTSKTILTPAIPGPVIHSLSIPHSPT